MAASLLSSLPQSTINDLLNLGILTMSISPYPRLPMDVIINSTLSPPSSGIPNTTFLKYLGTEMKRLAGSDEDPLIALTILKTYIGAVDTPDSDSPPPNPWAINATWISVAGFFIFLRLATKRFITVGVRRDDWAITGSWCLCLLMALVSHYAFDKSRPCKHIWNVSWFDFTWNIRSLFYNEIMYILSMYVLKCSIMLFYWDLIPHDSSAHFRVFHRTFIGTFLFVTAVSISVLFTIIFQCKPIAFWHNPLNAKCLPRQPVWTAASWLLFASDIVVLTLPIRIVWTLKLRTREKIIVIALFALGLLACLASVPRIITTSRFIDDPDLTYKQCTSGNWVFAESCLAIITSCVPATKALVIRYAPRIIGYSKQAISRQLSNMDLAGKFSRSRSQSPSRTQSESRETTRRDEEEGGIGEKEDRVRSTVSSRGSTVTTDRSITSTLRSNDTSATRSNWMQSVIEEDHGIDEIRDKGKE